MTNATAQTATDAHTFDSLSLFSASRRMKPLPKLFEDYSLLMHAFRDLGQYKDEKTGEWYQVLGETSGTDAGYFERYVLSLADLRLLKKVFDAQDSGALADKIKISLTSHEGLVKRIDSRKKQFADFLADLEIVQAAGKASSPHAHNGFAVDFRCQPTPDRVGVLTKEEAALASEYSKALEGIRIYFSCLPSPNMGNAEAVQPTAAGVPLQLNVALRALNHEMFRRGVSEMKEACKLPDGLRINWQRQGASFG